MPKQPTDPDGVGNDGENSPDSSQITRSLILQTAFTIIDRDGADSLSIRRLSESTPMLHPQSCCR